jgi:hypothetical protein
MLSFTPKSEEEVLNLLKPGVYDFQVKTAENSTSKKGNAMIKLTVVVWDKEGNEHYITDYLMASLMFKLKHFCDTVGLEEKYNQGQFTAEDCLNKSGKCKIRIDEAGEYPAKNSIQDYIKSCDKTTVIPLTQAKDDGFFDDNIPF